MTGPQLIAKVAWTDIPREASGNILLSLPSIQLSTEGKWYTLWTAGTSLSGLSSGPVSAEWTHKHFQKVCRNVRVELFLSDNALTVN